MQLYFFKLLTQDVLTCIVMEMVRRRRKHRFWKTDIIFKLLFTLEVIFTNHHLYKINKANHQPITATLHGVLSATKVPRAMVVIEVPKAIKATKVVEA